MINEKYEGLVAIFFAIVTGFAAYLDNISTRVFSLLQVNITFDVVTEKLFDITFGCIAAFSVAFAGYFGKNVASVAYRTLLNSRVGRKIKTLLRK